MSSYRFELVKLLAQWRVRIVLGLCAVVPAVFVGVISHQPTLPADTLFGRQMPATGWAGSLVVLSFACSWGLPLLTALIAGDVFAVEDRLGTWRHLVVAVRSPRRIFAAKALAAGTVLLLLVALLAASSVVGGLVASGGHALTGLDGQQIGSGSAARLVVLAWVAVLVPTAAFGAVGLLGSVLFGRSPVGLALPALLALALALVQLLPLPVAVRLALPSQALLGWRGLFTSPADLGGLWAGVLVCLAWLAVATLGGYLAFLRRDFTDTAYDGSTRRTLVAAVLPLGGLVAAAAVVLALAGAGTGTGISRPVLEDAVATSFAHLYRLQTTQLHRPAVTEDELASQARCARRPAGDWQCLISWRLPGSTAVGRATYQLDVTADGRYVADGDGPKEVNGSFTVHTPNGDAPNPLWQFDGLVDLLTHQSSQSSSISSSNSKG